MSHGCQSKPTDRSNGGWSVGLSIYCLSTYLSAYPSVFLSICLIIYLSICLSFCLSIRLSVYLSIYLSVYLSVFLSFYLSICLSVYLQVWKRSNSARPPWNLEVESWKTKLFWETSFRNWNGCSQLQNEKILQDFRSWQHQKRSNSARLSSKMESWVQSWLPHNNAVCVFSPLHPCKVSHLPRKN